MSFSLYIDRRGNNVATPSQEVHTVSMLLPLATVSLIIFLNYLIYENFIGDKCRIMTGDNSTMALLNYKSVQ